MKLKHLDAVLVRQAVITGRVHDELTGAALAALSSVALDWRVAGTLVYRDSGLRAHFKPGGYFAFAGDPRRVFPELQPGQSLQCQLTASSAGYQDGRLEFILEPGQTTPVSTEESLAGLPVSVPRLNAPVRTIVLGLQPLPVSLAGRVIVDQDNGRPMAGAAITIVAPAGGGSAVSDARGDYRIDNLPVVPRVTVKVSSAADSIQREILLDYRQRINQKSFSLIA